MKTQTRVLAACVSTIIASTASVSAANNVHLLNTFSTGLPRPHAATYDPGRDTVWLHGSFTADFVEADRSGVYTGSSFSQPGDLSDDSDVTIIEEPISINGVVVPAGTALFATGDDYSGPGNDAHLYAIDTATGAVLADMDLPDTLLGFNTSNNIVGIAHSSITDTLFLTSYASDAVMEFDPATASVLNEFTLSPAGTTPFDLFYGDIEFNEADGNLYAIGIEPVIRAITTDGTFLRDYDLTSLGVGVGGQLSGLGIDAARSEVWITSTNRNLYHLAIPEPNTFLLFCAGLCGLALRRRARRLCHQQ